MVDVSIQFLETALVSACIIIIRKHTPIIKRTVTCITVAANAPAQNAHMHGIAGFSIAVTKKSVFILQLAMVIAIGRCHIAAAAVH